MDKNTTKAADDKAEFLMELVERYNYWKGKNQPEYFTAYERLLFAFTSPQKEEPKNS